MQLPITVLIPTIRVTLKIMIHLAEPGKPLQLKFAASMGSNYILVFQMLYTGTNKMFHNQGNGITQDEYANTLYIFAWEITFSLSEMEMFH